MTAPSVDKNLARDIAKHVDRLKRRRKLLWWFAFLALAAVAVMYVTCGSGFGLGGKGKGEGAGSGATAAALDAGAHRCSVRVAAAGITVDGVARTRDEAVAACKPLGGADVVVTGDARQGDWDDLKQALAAAGVKVFTRQGDAP
jgi:hypothetical protein